MRIYSAPVLAQVAHIKHILEMHGIECRIQGEYRSGAAGEIPPTEAWARAVGGRSVGRRRGETPGGRGDPACGSGAAGLDVPALQGSQRGPVRRVLELRDQLPRGLGHLTGHRSGT